MNASFEDNNRAYLSAALTWLRLRLQLLEPFRRPEDDDPGAPTAPSEPLAVVPTSATSEPVEEIAAVRRKWWQAPSDVDSTPQPALSAPQPAPAPVSTPAGTGEAVRLPIDEQLTAAAARLREAEAATPSPALVVLAEALDLSPFERDTLLLCLAMELDSTMPDLCARACGVSHTTWPTFGLALSAFDGPRRDALSPERPLRRARLIEVHQSGMQPLIGAPLRIDERVAAFAFGLNYLDERLATIVQRLDVTDQPVADDDGLTASQRDRVDDAIDLITSHDEDAAGERLCVQIIGADRATRRAVARAVAQQLNARLLALTADHVPPSHELETFVQLWWRERRLLRLALLIEMPEGDLSADVAPDAQGVTSRLLQVASQTAGLILVSTRDVLADGLADAITIDVQRARPDEQAALWRAALGDEHSAVAEEVAAQFSIETAAIGVIGRRERAKSDDGEPLRDRVWRACVDRARPALEGLAQRIDARASWDSLKLPARETATLARIRDQMRLRAVVHGQFGFREHLTRGLGTAVLFCGEPGTGKTFAAEVLASALGLSLYRIDLAGIMNKYIGVTEKHIRQVFDAGAGAVMLFDEADALFGKRSEVKDSHDRYANIQIDYLLQRMESYSGLAILATNMRSAIDPAFLRRLRFVVNFPFPGPAEREAIWRAAFPGRTPGAADLDWPRLARIAVTGASIQNVALDAAFRAAAQGGPVTTALVIEAAADEMRKLDQTPSSSLLRLARPEPAAGAAV